jgi:hypothetical protein
VIKKFKDLSEEDYEKELEELFREADDFMIKS